MDRRSVLAGVGTTLAVGTAGCFGPFDAGETPTRRYRLELTVQNDHDRPYDVRAVMTDADERTVFEQSFTLRPGEGRGFGDEFPAGEYTLAVTLSDRSQSRSYWNTDLCDVHRVRTTVAADGRVSHAVACLDEDADPGPLADGEATGSE
ncbi:hypothetical protein [Natronomonas marina]|jgi:hypothetical protein|uniref:hypothetical protein n=1 Tax=Natronomonas marina TaxID=2961939 RepID=UPI0020C9908D|nr:hypothetical protein [Natronomonas marina]